MEKDKNLTKSIGGIYGLLERICTETCYCRWSSQSDKIRWLGRLRLCTGTPDALDKALAKRTDELKDIKLKANKLNTKEENKNSNILMIVSIVLGIYFVISVIIIIILVKRIRKNIT